MSNKIEIVDARNGDHFVVDGTKLRNLLIDKIGLYQAQYKQLLNRMLLELPDKESAIPLMVALHVGDHSINERALMFSAFLDRATWLDGEIRALTTVLASYRDGVTYRIDITQAARYGV